MKTEKLARAAQLLYRPVLVYALLKQEILIYTDNLYSFSKISCTYTLSNYDHLKERIHITDKIWSNKERLF